MSKPQVPPEYAKFYEHEHGLTRDQRLKLADVFYRITVSQSMLGIAGLAIGGTVPLLVLRYTGRKASKVTALHQTLGAMFGGFMLPQFCGSLLYQRQLDKLQDGDPEVYQTFELTPYPTLMAFMWRNYFVNDRKLPNPQQVQSALEKGTVDQLNVDRSGISPAWERVRNSKDPLHQTSAATNNTDPDDDDPFALGGQTKEVKPNRNESAWDRIRREQSVSYKSDE